MFLGLELETHVFVLKQLLIISNSVILQVGVNNSFKN